MSVKQGDKVKVEYEGSFDDGEIFDSTKTHGGEPLEFEVGAHHVIPGFENAVLGKELNEEFEIKLQPADAYGEHQPEGIQKLSRSQFPEDLKLENGMIFELQQEHGDHHHNIPAKIVKIEDEDISVDMNHPMAGKVLNFKMKIVGIN